MLYGRGVQLLAESGQMSKTKPRARVAVHQGCPTFFHSGPNYKFSHKRQQKKATKSNKVLPKFCDVYPDHDFLVHYVSNKKMVRDSWT